MSETHAQNDPKPRIFLSRASPDADAGAVVAAILRANGHEVLIQDDFGPESFMAKMREGFHDVERGGRVVALLSQAYLDSKHCLVEGEYPLIDDPDNAGRRLIVLRVGDVQPTAFLKPIRYYDLVPHLGQDAEAVGRIVRGAVNSGAFPADLSAASKAGVAPLQILHPRIEAVPDFAPRAEEAGLAEALAAHTRVALWGPPGVGKSLLAQHFAHTARERYRGVWWVQADSTLREDISALGRRISDEITHIEDADHRFRLSLDLIAQSGAERPWLLVYDNVASPADLAEACPREGARILITTNHQDWRGRGAEPVEIDVFDVETARTFLLDHAPSETGETAESADNLARALDYSPLALGIAAATCRPIQKSFTEYEAEIAASEAVLDAEDSADPRARSVAKAYGFALDRAATAEPAAEKLMRLICFFAPDAIPVSLIKEGGFEEANGEGSLDKALGALAGLSLVRIRRSEGGRFIDIHRLTQRVAKARLGQNREVAGTEAREALVVALPEISSQDTRSWPFWRTISPHLRCAIDKAEDLASATLSNGLATFLDAEGNLLQSEALYRRALIIRAGALGSTHSDTATSLNNLASFFFKQRRLEEAEPLLRQALAIREAKFGPEHPNTAQSLNNIAGLLQLQGRLTEAAHHFERALAICEKTVGPEHPETAHCLNNLGELYRSQDRLEEAEQALERARRIYEIELGGGHPFTAPVLNNLAMLNQDRGRLDIAEVYLRRSLEISETELGREHPSTAITLSNLARLRQKRKRFDDAKSLFERALAIREATLGPEHPDTALSLNNLALLFRDQGQFNDAAALLMRALTILEKAQGPEHPSTRTLRANLDVLRAEIAR